jgi:mannose-6-phosphate isomerase-like protein (cupin superfamily)
MTVANTYRLQVRTTADPLFETVARLVNPPATPPDATTFLPAYAGFSLGEGSEVDLSYFYAPPVDASGFQMRRRFDRHLRTEELWIVAEGDFLVPLAPCRAPDDPEDLPRPEDFLCFAIKQGDMFAVRPNVWHSGPWPTTPGTPVRFFMLLSGHRKQAGDGAAFVDFYQREFAGDAAVIPEADAPAA